MFLCMLYTISLMLVWQSEPFFAGLFRMRREMLSPFLLAGDDEQHQREFAWGLRRLWGYPPLMSGVFVSLLGLWPFGSAEFLVVGAAAIALGILLLNFGHELAFGVARALSQRR